MDDKFILYLQNNALSENTYLSYARDVKLFKDYYFDSYGTELDKLVHADISMYVQYLRNKNIDAKTINRKLSALKQYNLFLIEEQVQDKIVIVKKDYIKIQSSIIEKKIPTQQEINKLKHFSIRDDKNGKRDYCLVIIFSYGGVRESELVSIRISDIIMDERYIKIIGKGNKYRQVAINNVMYDALTEYLEERLQEKTDNPYLFIGQKNKNTTNPYRRNFCNRVLKKYQETYNIPDLHPHALRAFFCSNALHNAGYTIEQVANQAGHSSLNTTKTYLVTDPEDIVSLANKL